MTLTPPTAAEDRVSARADDGVLHVVISHPGRRNAFTWRMYDQLAGIADEAAAAADLRAVVIRGTAEGGFAAGTDIRQFAGFASGADGVAYERRVGAVVDKLLAVPVPVLGLVEGAAVGAGLVVACCCDVVVAERGARFGAPIVRTLGNCLPTAVVGLLRRRLGAAATDAMLLTGSLVSAEALVAGGFVHRVVDPGGLEAAAEDLLRRTRAAAPLAVRALKETGRRLDRAEPAPDNEDLQALCYGSADFAEGVAAFVSGRRPEWTGR